jgi:DUF4097 and DUF4098 domain-containing protein YvlB
MRFHSPLLLLVATVLVLAKTEIEPGRRVEVRTSNSSIDVVGFEGDQVTLDDSSHGAVRNIGGRIVVEGEGPLRIQVPHRSSLDIITSNGEIRVSGVDGSLQLTTSNGSIAVMDAGDAGVRAHTSNGRIDIGVARKLNASFSARTTNSRIHSDFELATSRVAETFLEGQLGTGGTAIDLQTSNGAIYLKNGGDQENASSTFLPAVVK